MAEQNRKSIKREIQKKLSSNTLAKRNVFTNRLYPARNFPAIFIYALEENVTLFNQSPKEYKRSLSLIIEGVVDIDSDDPTEDLIDELEAEIHALMNQDYTLNGTCEDVQLNSINFDYDRENELILGSVKLSYTIDYITNDLTFKEYEDLEGFNPEIEISQG